MTERYNPTSHPTLRKWTRGQTTVKLQRRLCAHLSNIQEDDFVDGIFGPGTEQRVKEFQREQRLVVDGIVGRNTWTPLLREPQTRIPSPAGATAKTTDRQRATSQNKASNGGGPLASRVLNALRRKNYAAFDDGDPFHLNIIGVRAASGRFDHFDDTLYLIYRDENGEQRVEEYPITTDPGSYYTQTRLLNEDGVAILMPGQYRDTYLLGKHRSQYDALVQRGGTVRVWRDNSRTNELNRGGRVFEGWFGINIHRARATGTTARIGSHSAGCQVFKDANQFAVLMDLVKKSTGVRHNRFTYTLLEENDL